MKYDHEKYVGNHADQLKHLMLRTTLEHLKATKAEPIQYIDTHSAYGLYTIDHDLYLGSPAIAAQILDTNDQDTLLLCERDVNVASELALNVNGDNIEVSHQDGFYGHNQRLRSMTHHSCVLVDPPYKQLSEYFEVLGLAAKCSHNKNNTMLIWLPYFKSNKLTNEVKAQLTNIFQDKWVNCFDLIAEDYPTGPDFIGSTVAVVSDDHVLFDKLSTARAELQEKFNKKSK